MFLLMVLCFGLAALALLGGAVWTYFSQARKMESRSVVAGTVVELAEGVGAAGHASMFYPVVAFTASSGEKIKFRTDFGSRPAGYTVGQNVTVRYDPADPQQAEIESPVNLWLVPIILGFMGAVAGCLAISFLGFFVLGASSFSP
jgi:hypothetical protein